jgi:hypothetical protein
MNKYISAKASPIERELDELLEMEESISHQTDMRDIFITYFLTSRYHREVHSICAALTFPNMPFFQFSRRALFFRRALADLKHDKTTLQEIWDSGKREGLETVVKDLEPLKEEVDREELVNHFDEKKKLLKPLVRNVKAILIN